MEYISTMPNALKVPNLVVLPCGRDREALV